MQGSYYPRHTQIVLKKIRATCFERDCDSNPGHNHHADPAQIEFTHKYIMIFIFVNAFFFSCKSQHLWYHGYVA